jgi:hypothetical protein
MASLQVWRSTRYRQVPLNPVIARVRVICASRFGFVMIACVTERRGGSGPLFPPRVPEPPGRSTERWSAWSSAHW